MSKKKIQVDNIDITIIQKDGSDYVNITDIAKQSERKAGDTINDWLKNSKTLLFLETWEVLNNPNFKVRQMQDFRLKISNGRFFLSVQKYINETGAIGLISKSGRNGGTFAHSQIAFDFCGWFDAKFKAYLYFEFERLKKLEASSDSFYLNKMFDDSLQINRMSKELLQKRGELPPDENE